MKNLIPKHLNTSFNWDEIEKRTKSREQNYFNLDSHSSTITSKEKNKAEKVEKIKEEVDRLNTPKKIKERKEKLIKLAIEANKSLPLYEYPDSNPKIADEPTLNEKAKDYWSPFKGVIERYKTAVSNGKGFSDIFRYVPTVSGITAYIDHNDEGALLSALFPSIGYIPENVAKTLSTEDIALTRPGFKYALDQKDKIALAKRLIEEKIAAGDYVVSESPIISLDEFKDIKNSGKVLLPKFDVRGAEPTAHTVANATLDDLFKATLNGSVVRPTLIAGNKGIHWFTTKDIKPYNVSSTGGYKVANTASDISTPAYYGIADKPRSIKGIRDIIISNPLISKESKEYGISLLDRYLQLIGKRSSGSLYNHGLIQVAEQDLPELKELQSKMASYGSHIFDGLLGNVQLYGKSSGGPLVIDWKGNDYLKSMGTGKMPGVPMYQGQNISYPGIRKISDFDEVIKPDQIGIIQNIKNPSLSNTILFGKKSILGLSNKKGGKLIKIK